ncbi:hypothetical protein SADUNF_Sadunf04G0083300 [Salix dunnii]|uniref:Uncharacterized protein n=1 Tax=Salix dunnii TaxID=1413687 RepID=A0A835KDU2_9ROSI|nr:hypothetical protein SADUNF_Sadunf04G0083300 [Salix dunnii]
MSITSYYTKLKSYWDELSSYNQINTCPSGRDCGAAKSIMDHAEQQHLMQLLMGLDESYASTRSNILIMAPLPTTRRAYSLLLQDEKQRQVATISTCNSESMAMLSMSNNNSKRNNTIKYSNRSLYSNNNVNISRSNQQEPRRCPYCNGDTHNVEKCFFLKGFPPGHKWHGKEPPIPPPRFDGSNRQHQGRIKHFNQTSTRQQFSANCMQASEPIHHLQSIAPHLSLDQCKQIMETVGKEDIHPTQENFAEETVQFQYNSLPSEYGKVQFQYNSLPSEYGKDPCCFPSS